jgi:hypothetical protein
MHTNQVQFQLLLTWAGWAVPSAHVKSRVRRLLLGGAMRTNQIQFSTVAGLGGVGCAHCTSQVQSPTVAARRSHAHESDSISNCCWPGRGGLCHVHKPSPESNGRCLEEPSARIKFNFQLLLAWAGWAVPRAQVKSRGQRLLLGRAFCTNQVQFATVAGLGGVGCAQCTSQVQSATVAAWKRHALLLGRGRRTKQVQFATVAGLGGVGCAQCTSQVHGCEHLSNLSIMYLWSS